MMEKYVEYLKDTIEFYGENPGRRAVRSDSCNSNSCTYVTLDERMCAVGRLCDQPTLDFFQEIDDDFATCMSQFYRSDEATKGIEEGWWEEGEYFYELPCEDFAPRTCDGLPFHENVDFWECMQSLHDNASNWKELPSDGEVKSRDKIYAGHKFLTIEGLMWALKCCQRIEAHPRTVFSDWTARDEWVYKKTLSEGCGDVHIAKNRDDMWKNYELYDKENADG